MTANLEHYREEEKQRFKEFLEHCHCKCCDNIGSFRILSQYTDYRVTEETETAPSKWETKNIFVMKCNACSVVNVAKYDYSEEDDDYYREYVERNCENIFHDVSFPSLIDSDVEQISFSEIKDSREIPKLIREKFPEYVEIFTQSEQAEQANLTKICGIAYRRALEFLIIEYMKLELKNDTIYDKNNKILPISKIVEKIQDQEMKDIAKRAVWLGNDEAHYDKKWNKEVRDLKELLIRVETMIEMKMKAKEIVNIMPENFPK